MVDACEPTCAGVCLLGVDLQEDEHGEEQEPAVGPVWGLPRRGPTALRRWVQDPTGTTEPGQREIQGGGHSEGTG